MYCSRCGTQNQGTATFCAQCGSPMAGGQPAQVQDTPALVQTTEELAGLGLRVVSAIVDGIITAIPYIGFVVGIVNVIMYRRGNTIGLKLVGARIVRENGDVSGFFHTFVRSAASILSIIPLGLGYAWALWDPQKQTWHDKIMHTHVLRDTPELAARQGTSSGAAVAWFWILLVSSLVGIIVYIAAIEETTAF